MQPRSAPLLPSLFPPPKHAINQPHICAAWPPLPRLQGEVFDQFLRGDSLEECYDAVAAVANRWLDMLDTRVGVVRRMVGWGVCMLGWVWGLLKPTAPPGPRHSSLATPLPGIAAMLHPPRRTHPDTRTPLHPPCCAAGRGPD